MYVSIYLQFMVISIIFFFRFYSFVLIWIQSFLIYDFSFYLDRQPCRAGLNFGYPAMWHTNNNLSSVRSKQNINNMATVKKKIKNVIVLWFYLLLWNGKPMRQLIPAYFIQQSNIRFNSSTETLDHVHRNPLEMESLRRCSIEWWI